MTSESSDLAFGSPAHLAREITPGIEKAVLQLVVDGFERWRVEGFKRVGDHEDHYTVRLVACMKEIRRERNMALVPVFQHVEHSDAMLEGREDPAHAPHIDMVVSWGAFAEDAYLSIECKRLAPDDLARLYVVCGIDRFVRGYYGAKSQTGAMVGYLINGTSSVVLGRVNGHISRNPSMGPRQVLAPANPIEWLDSVYSSSHPRPLPFDTIRLSHLFFDMNGIGPPP